MEGSIPWLSSRNGPEDCIAPLDASHSKSKLLFEVLLWQILLSHILSSKTTTLPTYSDQIHFFKTRSQLQKWNIRTAQLRILFLVLQRTKPMGVWLRKLKLKKHIVQQETNRIILTRTQDSCFQIVMKAQRKQKKAQGISSQESPATELVVTGLSSKQSF